MAGRPLVIKADSPDGPLRPPGSLIAPAADLLGKGGVVAYPTETFYGLAVDPFNPEAIKRLFALKGRPETNPISLIISDLAMLKGVAAQVTPQASVLMEAFWPGPLTLVLKAAPAVPASLIAGTGKVGVRLSSHPVARALSKACSSPITATSANPTGSKPPATPQDVLDYFGASLDALIDCGDLQGRLGSTVVDVSEDQAVIVREGEIPSTEVFAALDAS